jgi:hypothetical protein
VLPSQISAPPGRSPGGTAVTLLGSADLPLPSAVDLGTLRLNDAPATTRVEDINQDDHEDLIVTAAGVSTADGPLCVTGLLTDGIDFVSCHQSEAETATPTPTPPPSPVPPPGPATTASPTGSALADGGADAPLGLAAAGALILALGGALLLAGDRLALSGRSRR